jgi:hypothetical protein
MKLFILLSVITLSTQVMSAEVLLKLQRGSGFGPVVSHSSLTITEDGQVTKMISQAGSVRKVSIGKLSANVVANLKDKIETIADNGKLINLDAQRPRCMDAPSTSLTVNKGGKEITISAWRMCQRFETKDLETKSLKSLAESFDYIAE